jgi:hypothetical protein
LQRVETSPDISRDLETALTEQYACEKEPDAGEFYTLIRQHQQTGHALFEQLWWARLEAVGPRRKQNMDRILKNPHYRAAFDCQLDMPGLAGGMNLGTVHHMFAMKCDEVRDPVGELHAGICSLLTPTGKPPVPQVRQRHLV